MRGTGAPRARESVPSSEAGWKQPETGRNTFSCVEDTHPTALGYSFSLSCLVSLDDPGRSQKEDIASELGLGDNLEVTSSRWGCLFAWVFGRKNRNQPVHRPHSDLIQHRG